MFFLNLFSSGDVLKTDFLKNNWHIILLVVIFLLSFYIRIINVTPDRIVSFDPVYQLRFVSYLSEWGTLPVWDELTYYVGRLVTVGENPPFMWYLTVLASFITGMFGMSLTTTASYLAGLFGALITIPAYLLGKELSNKYGGLLSATLMGTAPQILIRTFGGSFDTDQLVLFFILFTLYLGYYALRKKTVASYCYALIGFFVFMLTWNIFTYTFFILSGFVVVYFLVGLVLGSDRLEEEKRNFSNKIRKSFQKLKSHLIVLVSLLVGISVTGLIVKSDVISKFLILIEFARQAESLIVNISIAELQPFSVFNANGWFLTMGRFLTENVILNHLILILFFGLIFTGFYLTYKKNIRVFSFLLTLLVVALYTTTRGIRFTEFTSALFIILISVGFGYLFEYLSKREAFLKSVGIGMFVMLFIIAFAVSQPLAQNLGPDNSPNWNAAWSFIKENTPELSLIGTWWDPGHMIAGTAERRNMADGAHCSPSSCMYSINDRITDAGKIMATTDEAESVKLINKYKGNSPKVYWIASSDLIGKFQWIQYFGTGCDARVSPQCPLYYQIGLTDIAQVTGDVTSMQYNNVFVLVKEGSPPIPFIVQNRNAMFFKEVIYYTKGGLMLHSFTQETVNNISDSLKPLEDQMGIVFNTQINDLTVWLPPTQSYVVLIPPHLRESVFTKMFMLEGSGLENFRQVFRNEDVKIYEVIF